MMATVNEKLRDDLIKHQIEIVRLSTWAAKQLNKRIAASNKPTMNLIIAAYPKLSTQLSKRSNANFKKLEKEIEKTRGAAFDVAEDWYDDAAHKFVQAEFAFMPKIINKVMPVDYKWMVPTDRVNSIVAYTAPGGATLPKWFDTFKDADSRRIARAVRSGMGQGQTIKQLETMLKSQFAITENGANMLARTTVNGLANEGRKQFALANKDVIDWEVYTATLDARTSVACRGFDGTHHEVGEGPIPPLHPNCRSTRVPVLDGIGLIGDRAAVGGTNFMKQAQRANGKKWIEMSSRAKKAAMIKARNSWSDKIYGSVPATTNYEEFLTRQPAEYQNEVLGKRKAQLWRKGELTFKQMYDSRTYRELSLDDLQKRYGIKI